MELSNRINVTEGGKRSSIKEKGFTLVELMAAMVIAVVVMAGIYAAYYTQQKNATAQEQTAEMRQNLRAGLDLMTREIRMAGFDPTHAAGAGIVTPTANSIVFTSDLNGDGDTADTDENITYALSGTILQRNGQAVAENIDAVNFVYLDGSGNVTAILSDVRSVQITAVARTGRGDPGYTNTDSYTNQQGAEILAAQNDSFRRRLLSMSVICRNLGLE
jgi:type IV pilus assembly protein PilW